MDKEYSNEITGASYMEMVALAGWMNKMHGHYPLIVGGWAVWCHVRGLGSRDIDVVFPTRTIKHAALIEFLKANGYKERGLFVKEFYKEITGEKIYIDACSPEDLNYLKDDPDVVLPWQLGFDHSLKYELEKEVFIYIPRTEVLLLYKAKALLDRRHDLRSAGSHPFIESKLRKDSYDMAALLAKGGLDTGFLKKLLAETGFGPYFLKSLELLVGEKDVVKVPEVSKVIERLLGELRSAEKA